MAGENAHLGRFAADAHGKFLGAGAALGCGLEGGLDDPILQGMEGDDSQPDRPGSGRSTAAVSILFHGGQLVVDGDADGLEAPLGRVLLFPARAWGGHGAADDLRQLQRGLDGLFSPALFDGGGDAGGVALLAVGVEDAFEFGPPARCSPLHKAVRPPERVHAHIQRRVVHIGKAAFGVVPVGGRRRPGRRASRPRRGFPAGPAPERAGQNCCGPG